MKNIIVDIIAVVLFLFAVGSAISGIKIVQEHPVYGFIGLGYIVVFNATFYYFFRDKVKAMPGGLTDKIQKTFLWLPLVVVIELLTILSFAWMLNYLSSYSHSHTRNFGEYLFPLVLSLLGFALLNKRR